MSLIIDISSNNGQINWDEVKAHDDTLPDGLKIKGVMVKANEGYLCEDKGWKDRAAEAVKRGYPVGYYHFATLNTFKVIEDAEQEANYFLKSLADAPKADMPIALDIETNKVNLPAPQVVLWAKTFFSVLKNAGVTNLALYSGQYFLNSEHFIAKDFEGIKLWVAEYISGTFKLPVGFEDYWAHQYTSEGIIDGIKGHVDISQLKTS